MEISGETVGASAPQRETRVERSPTIIPFQRVGFQQEKQLGGKAFALGILLQKQFPVPDGCVVTSMPISENEWNDILQWWKEAGYPNLAVRSSARGEDSREFSFAGQQTTVLNVQSEAALRGAIKKCFDSVHGKASQAYRSFFKQEDSDYSMNVVLQRMVKASFAGVFFSQDPRGKSAGWVLEVIEGLGEDLVSGRKTPARFQPGQSFENQSLKSWEPSYGNQVVDIGRKVSSFMGYEVDMEWAIDEQGTFWVLQARPVTAIHSHSNQEKEILKELNRLRDKHHRDVIWDGQTFAEWTGFPSYLTFSIWKDAFSPTGAFGTALDRLGYVGSKTSVLDPKESLLERVFGRAYVNLSLLEPLFFGDIPYRIVPKPRPHLQFCWSKLNLKMILRAPKVWIQMAKVGWKLQTRRRQLIGECRKGLNAFKDQMARPLNPQLYESWSDEKLRQQFQCEATEFAHDYLHWPFVLIIMAESTLQSLQASVAKAKGQKVAEELIRQWMADGLMTSTTMMNQAYYQACLQPEKRPFFLGRYGHRGPGELDLTNPRWIELGDRAFRKPTKEFTPQVRKSVEESINEQFSRFRSPLILQEWRLLKKMLELREQWKMELMKSYAHLRWIALELGKRIGVGQDIFWFRLSEVLNLRPALAHEGLEDRKQRFDVFRNLSFPVVTSLNELEKILSDKESVSKESVMEGEPLSPGMAHGQVRVVSDPNQVDTSQWPSDVILVAEATDPGWTPLFQHARAVVVEKGGVLSHCAIVAREMGLPAVSGIRQCHYKLKDGDHVWVDGDKGRVLRS